MRLGAVAGLFQVELERAAGKLLNELGKPGRRLAEPRQMRAVNHGHDEPRRLGRNAWSGERDDEETSHEADGGPSPRHYPLLDLVFAGFGLLLTSAPMLHPRVPLPPDTGP